MKRKTAHRKNTSRKISKKTTSSRLFTILVVSVILIVVAENIPATTALNAQIGQSVLGEEEQKQGEHKEEKKEEEHKSENSNSGSGNAQEEQKKQEESRREREKNTVPQLKTKTDTVQGGFRIKTQSEGNKQETEIEGLNGQKIKTKVEDSGIAKVEVEENGMKLKYIVEDGKIKLKIENEDGTEREAEKSKIDDLQNEIENELEDEGIEIATGEGKIKLAKNNVSAFTQFPLSVNVSTNQLVVTTPQGQKVVAILPDQAVQNLLNTGIVNRVEGTGTDSAQLDTLDSDIKLEMRNGEVVYRIKGVTKKKLFGLIPIETPVTAFVSAESGVPVAREQSLLSNVLNTFSQ